MNKTGRGVPTESDDRVASSLVGVITKVRRFLRLGIRSTFSWESLPMAQVEFLQRLAEESGLRLGELAEKHWMATNTVSTIIQQMVVKGLVIRETDPTDRRAVTLRLSEEGEKNLRSWMDANEKLLSLALGRLSSEQTSEIERALPSLRVLADELDWVETQLRLAGKSTLAPIFPQSSDS